MRRRQALSPRWTGPCLVVAGPAILAFVLLLAPAALAQIGTPVDLGSTQADNVFTTSLSVTTTQAAPADGSIIVIALSEVAAGSPPTSATCSDSAGNTYSTDVSKGDSVGLTAICSTHAIAGQLATGSKITVTWSGGGAVQEFQRMHAFSVTGLASAPLDATASENGTSKSPSSGPTATTVQASELLFGAITNDNNTVAGAAFSPGTNGTSNNCATTGTPTYSSLGGVDGLGTIPAIFGMYCIVSATDSYIAQGTFGSTATPAWQALLATYKAAAVGGGPVPMLSPLGVAALTLLLMAVGALALMTGRKIAKVR